ncbi:MAG: hypothetical protein WDZ35_10075 [Crocinitomicaceae bacterium]
MIAFLKRQRILITLVTFLFIFHWFSKDIRNPYERPIVGDAQAYWSYLPALFIYNDPNYTFIETDAAQYYPEGQTKDFVKKIENGASVNKTFPGVAILYAPFFLLGHVSAHLFGYPADGFSIVYQFWFDVGLWCYFLFGLIFLNQFLKKLGFSAKISLFATVLTAVGTNIFFYTVYDQSVTHIYNFCMINALLLCLAYFKENQAVKWLALSLALLALIGITRPTNVLVIGLIFIFFPQKEFYRQIFQSIFSKKWWLFALASLPILSIPFLLWKWQSGQWIVYSYGEEGFNFSDPHLMDFIFSYTKGWFTYTPLALLILLIGCSLVLKRSFTKGGMIIGFYLISIYIFSSWWCWYYGAGMSQRVMIDHYVLLAYLLAVIVKTLKDRPMLLRFFMSIVALLTVLNIAQAYQIKKGIIQFGSATKEQYWDNFLQFHPRAKIYPPSHWQWVESVILEKNDPSPELKVSSNHPFSTTLNASILPLQPNSKVIVSFEAKAKSAVADSRAVLFLYDQQKNEHYFPFYFHEFVRADQWVTMEFLLEPESTYTDSVKLYFWNGNTEEEVEFRNIHLSHYTSDQSDPK